ncbi:uncharacterized protein LOC144085667 [Stigmatopora argus]
MLNELVAQKLTDIFLVDSGLSSNRRGATWSDCTTPAGLAQYLRDTKVEFNLDAHRNNQEHFFLKVTMVAGMLEPIPAVSRPEAGDILNRWPDDLRVQGDGQPRTLYNSCRRTPDCSFIQESPAPQ